MRSSRLWFPSARATALRRSAALGLAGACAIQASIALAQDAQDVAAARALGQKGTLAAQGGKCEEAVDLLSRARALMPVPTVLTPLGECQIKLGHLVDGTESLQASVRTELDANAPRAFVKAQARAKDLLQATLPRLAHLVVEVKAPKGVSFKVTDNGNPVSDVLVGVDRPVDPGKHAIEVLATGFLPGRVTVQVAEGQKESAPIELSPDPRARPADAHDEVATHAPEPGLAPTAPSPEPTQGNGQLVAGAVTTAVGGVGLVLGGVFGGLALSKRSSLDKVCTNRQCPATSQSDIDAMKTFANTSTGLLVVGGLAAVTGTIVLVTVPARAPKRAKQGLTMDPFIGLGSLGVTGTF